MDRKKAWMYIAVGAIILSVISLFLPVIVYRNSSGTVYSFNIVRIITRSSDFIDYVLSDNDGSFASGVHSSALISLLSMTSDDLLPRLLLILMALISVGAIVAAFLGIRSMSRQYESAWPFRLTVTGLVLTAIPALAILFLALLSRGCFHSPIRLGTYVFITPLAMVAAIVTVTGRHRLTLRERQLQLEASRYLRPAGDLL